MARPSKLDPYRDLLQQWQDAGQTASAMRHALEAQYGVVVPDSTWFDFCKKTLRPDASPPRGAPPEPWDALAALVQGATGEVLDRLADLIAGVQHLHTASTDQHATVLARLSAAPSAQLHATLERHTAAFEALLARIEATARWRARLRIGLVTALLTSLAWLVGLWRIGRLPW